jgi:hypothetical protein
MKREGEEEGRKERKRERRGKTEYEQHSGTNAGESHASRTHGK